jgi:hypothetical protein
LNRVAAFGTDANGSVIGGEDLPAKLLAPGDLG